jgi:hypothetical protein
VDYVTHHTVYLQWPLKVYAGSGQEEVIFCASTGARGEASHTEGIGTDTTGIGAHAEGYFTTAKGEY